MNDLFEELKRHVQHHLDRAEFHSNESKRFIGAIELLFPSEAAAVQTRDVGAPKGARPPSARRLEVKRRHDAGENLPQIAAALGVTRQAVDAHLKALGIERRRRRSAAPGRGKPEGFRQDVRGRSRKGLRP